LKLDKYLIDSLECVYCALGKLKLDEENSIIYCDKCDVTYPVIDNVPVIINDEQSLFKRGNYVKRSLKPVKKSISLSLFNASVNLSRKKILKILEEVIKKSRKSFYILVVGSGSQNDIRDLKKQFNDKLIICHTDIDVHSNVDIFCDAHSIPFKSKVFDAVYTTAVIEHVMYPEAVINQIWRVLKVGGLIYSETPFMQQVHEGAYDFTRYTLNGHMRLLNKFKVLKVGMVAGPGTSLYWSIENYFLSFTAINLLRIGIKVITRILFFFIKYTDYYLQNKSQALDGASCTYVFAEKISEKVSDQSIIDGYRGCKHINHI
jgi:uncharacterized protein YbaR (Trm112 family)